MFEGKYSNFLLWVLRSGSASKTLIDVVIFKFSHLLYRWKGDFTPLHCIYVNVITQEHREGKSSNLKKSVTLEIFCRSEVKDVWPAKTDWDIVTTVVVKSHKLQPLHSKNCWNERRLQFFVCSFSPDVWVKAVHFSIAGNEQPCSEVHQKVK